MGRDARERGGTPENQGRILKMQIRYMKGSRDLLLKLWDPIHISGTSEAKNFRFGIHIDNECRYRNKIKISQRSRESVKRPTLLNFGTISISRE